MESILDTRLQRDSKFNCYLSGLVLEEIINSEVHLVEVIRLARLKFRAQPDFLDKKRAIITIKNTANRCYVNAAWERYIL